MAAIFQRGRSWGLDWRHPKGGARHRRILGSEPHFTQGDAELALKALELELASGNPILSVIRPRAADESWHDFVERYLEWHRQEYPASHWRIALIFQAQWQNWAPVAVAAILQRDVEQWLQARTRQVAPGTAQKELRSLKAAFHKAAEWGLIAKSPAANVRPPRNVNDEPVVFYSKAELEQLYAVCTVRNAAIWKLLANTGLRRAEALHLAWSDVSATAITVRSTEQWRTKSGKWRHIPLSPGAAHALDSLRGVSGAVRVLPDITPHALTRQFQRDLRRAKLRGNLHQLRHTFASHLVMAGRPLYEVKELLGHASIETTQIYAHLAPEHLQAAVSGINL